MSFAPIADSLREEVLGFYADGSALAPGVAGFNTLETNSGFVERRGLPLLTLLSRSMGRPLEGLDVADLGCGFGALSVFFAWSGASVVGLDPNAARFKVGTAVARRHGLSVRFEKGEMESIPLPDRSCDVAIQNNSFCYVVDPERRRRALAETLRILRPGGWLVARNPNRWHPADQFTGLPGLQLLPPEAARGLARAMRRERSLVRITSPPAHRRELRQAGFAQVDHVAAPGSRWPTALKRMARYHHFVAMRPPDGSR